VIGGRFAKLALVPCSLLLALPSIAGAATWKLVPVPSEAGAVSQDLYGIACSSTTACTGVGAYLSSGFTAGGALAARWNGSTWALQSVPNAKSASTYLYGVSCPSATACFAGGQTSTEHSIVERWRAGKWAIVPTPNPPNQSAELVAISCSSAKSCIAVGNRGLFTGSDTPFSLYWNGTTWTAPVTPAPSLATQSGLSGVSCTSASSCVAVGDYSISTTFTGTFGETWNGTKWTVKATPAPTGSSGSSLAAVYCSSGTACTAVGTFNSSTVFQEGYAIRLKAGKWAVQSTSSPSDSTLDGASCSTASSCEAVGNSSSGVLAEQWNALAWTVQPTPSPSGPNPLLTAVSCQSTSACLAVGHTNIESGDSTLSMQYS
jgi:hypothetical protein